MDPNESQEALKSVLKSPEISETVVCPTCGVTIAVGISICPNDKTVLGTSLESTKRLPVQFEVIEEIGSGGMGVIYKARHLSLGILVAIKMLNISRLDEAAMQRFEQEAKALSLLEHPNIVGIRDYGVTASGQPYMVLDYLDALTLEQHLNWNGPCSEAECLDIFLMAADALAHAHERGVLHRDIKPSNIMLLRNDSGAPSIKIVDFGIAKVIDPSLSGNPQVTRTGEILGSPAYMSPEQALGKPLDQRSDIFSLACVMYESLTGTPPFTGSNPISILTSLINDSPLPISQVMGEKAVSANLEQIVQKSLSKDPNDRFQTMGELKSFLDIAKRGIALPVEPPSPEEIASQSKKRKEKLAWRLCAVLVVAMLIGGLSWANMHEKAGQNKVKLATCQIEITDSDTRKFIRSEAAHKNEIDFHLLKVHDGTLSEFDSLHNVQSILMRDSDVTGSGLAHLIHLPLKKLDLKYTEVTDRGCSEIHHMKNLQYLNLANCHVHDAGVEQLSSLNALTLLDLSANNLTSKAIFNLHRLPQLQMLYFAGNSLSAEGATELGKFPALGALFLNDSVVQKGVVENLKDCKLVNLDLSTTNITAAQVRSLSGLPRLGTLNLQNCHSLDGLDCSIFRNFTNLRTLNLGSIKVSDSSLGELKNSRVEELGLEANDISDKGLDVLSDDKRLRTIFIKNCRNLTDKAIESFKRKRPDCPLLM